MTDMPQETVQSATGMAAVSSAMVKLHKEQFGRGPTHARAHWAGRDVVVCVLENALLPGERAMVEIGEEQRVREARNLLQAATQSMFVDAVEAVVGRRVRAFSSAIDPLAGVLFEVFALEPENAVVTDGPG